jgi:hypothetical protein
MPSIDENESSNSTVINTDIVVGPVVSNVNRGSSRSRPPPPPPPTPLPSEPSPTSEMSSSVLPQSHVPDSLDSQAVSNPPLPPQLFPDLLATNAFSDALSAGRLALRSPAKTEDNKNPNSRDDLLESINSGNFVLKPVIKDDKTSNNENTNGGVFSFMDQLSAFRQAVQDSSDEDDF